MALDPTRLIDGDPATIDDDFLYHLYRGGELLSAGDVHKAKDELEKAFQLKPRDNKGQNMLGLVYFKLGMYERAQEIYGALVRDNPIDPTLRVNLGLVQLKSGRLHEAIRELEAAVDLAPEHKKAHNYLGLALAQAGDYGRARESFLKAGSEQMADKMARALAGLEAPPVAPPRRAPGQAVLPSVAERGLGELDEAEQPFRAVDPDAQPEGPQPDQGWIAAGASEPGARATLQGAPRTQSLAEFAQVVRLEPPLGGPFAVSSDGVSIEIAAEVFTRLDGLVATRGGVTFEPVRKRFRGRTTDKPFGEGARQVWRAGGAGRILLSSRDGGAPRTFTTLRLADEDVYVCEEPLFAFEEALLFENGRVPGKPQDLALVHLRGNGQILLATARPIRSVRAQPDGPLRVPVSALVGWAGALTPRLLAIAELAPEQPAILAVELAGEGEVLLVP